MLKAIVESKLKEIKKPENFFKFLRVDVDQYIDEKFGNIKEEKGMLFNPEIYNCSLENYPVRTEYGDREIQEVLMCKGITIVPERRRTVRVELSHIKNIEIYERKEDKPSKKRKKEDNKQKQKEIKNKGKND